MKLNSVWKPVGVLNYCHDYLKNDFVFLNIVSLLAAMKDGRNNNERPTYFNCRVARAADIFITTL